MRIVLAVAAAVLVACGSAQGSGCGSPPPTDIGGFGASCGNAGHLAEMIATDLRTYSPGAPISVTVTATNTGSEGCAAPTACPPLPVVIEDSNGRQVWSPPNVRQVCPAMARLLNPGESVSYVAKTEGLTLTTGSYSTTGARADLAAAYGRSYFTVC
ncbi:MAG: hypothetical protein M3Z98_03325 [Candidatus Dormibacteraeota bacterium]|nr:hypothetical protein [Candidatus Dormibacteraeota bacterium]